MRWRKGANEGDINLALKLLSSSRTINEDGSISQKDFGQEASNWLDVLETNLVSVDLSPPIRRNFLESAARNAQDLEKRSFLAEMQRQRNDYLAVPKSVRLVVFPILGSLEVLPKFISVKNCEIYFVPNTDNEVYKNIVASRKEQQGKNPTTNYYSSDLSRSQLVICRIHAITNEDAVHFAERTLRLTLGMATFASSYGVETYNILSENEGSLSRFLIVPHISIHEKSGQISDQRVWVVAWSNGLRPYKFQGKYIPLLKARYLNFSRYLSQLSYREFIEERLIEFHEACSEPIQANVFLKMWRVFEKLLGVKQGDAKKGLARSSVIFSDRNTALAIGNHLQHRRNEMIHNDAVLDYETIRTNYQLKRLMDPLILRLLCNKLGLSRVEEHWDILDRMNSGSTAVEEQIRNFQLAKLELKKIEKK